MDKRILFQYQQLMDLDIYNSTKNWKFTELDHQAEEKFSQMEEQTRKQAPQNFYHYQTITHLDFMKKSPLYPVLQTLPKAVLHHVHFDCCEDVEFYQQYIINDPTVWLTPDRKQMIMGTKKEAETNKWISMAEERKNHSSDLAMAEFVSTITMFKTEQFQSMSFKQKEMWERFEGKISNFFSIIFALHIFKKYTKHMLLKYIRNGYDRIEFRAFLAQLKEYDQEGNIVKDHDEKMFMDAFDEVYNEVRKENPTFSAGFVFFGLKVFNQQQNFALFDKICQLNWDKTIGLDFVQQEDMFGSLQLYDPIIDKVLAKYPHLDYKKVYHAGETKNHKTHNMDIAIKAGSVRIGHGFNILQRIQFLPHCKNICFEKNPLSNIILGYNEDVREGSAPVLLGMGYAVTINPDDPGKFGVDDSTIDYFLAAISYNWTLRDLKLIAYHSINHAICDQHTRNVCLKQFEKRWNEWVVNFVGKEHIKVTHRWQEPDIFSNVRGWSWSEKEAKASENFVKLADSTIDSLPENFHQEKMLSHLKFMRQQKLFSLMKTIPKGSMHHLHFDCNDDVEFYQKHVITDSRIYLSKDRKEFKVGTAKQAEEQGWLSWQKLREEHKSDQQLASYLYSLTSFTHEEMLDVAGNGPKFWPPFEQKIMMFDNLLITKHIFVKYCDHLLRKYLSNGYERLEFRALLVGLKQYDNEGNLVKEHEERSFTEAFDQVYEQVRKEFPYLTVGFIFFGLLDWNQEQNYTMLKKVLSLNWRLTVGVDFVQEEEPHGSLAPYDKVADRVLEQFPEQNIKKCYHAGDTRNHKNDNIKVALKAGAVRIGHGLNIVHHSEIIPLCTKTCFELCPVSNVITASSARLDLRLSTAPILLGLGIPVSISPDDPGKFGYEDTTVDYFCAGVSFNWTLKHFKLIAIHSINYSICSEGNKIRMMKTFNERWNKWLEQFQ